MNESLLLTETIADRVVKNNTTTGVSTYSISELHEENKEAFADRVVENTTTTKVMTNSISELHEEDKKAIADRVVKNNTTTRAMTDSISERVLKYKTPQKHRTQLIPQWFYGAKSLIKVK